MKLLRMMTNPRIKMMIPTILASLSSLILLAKCDPMNAPIAANKPTMSKPDSAISALNPWLIAPVPAIKIIIINEVPIA